MTLAAGDTPSGASVCGASTGDATSTSPAASDGDTPIAGRLEALFVVCLGLLCFDSSSLRPLGLTVGAGIRRRHRGGG